MKTVGIRALKQNASAVVAEAAAGEVIVITDRGRPVAQIIPYPVDPIERLIAAGRVRLATGSLADLEPPDPLKPGERPGSEVLAEMRAEERY